jgi:hypothetical protein
MNKKWLIDRARKQNSLVLKNTALQRQFYRWGNAGRGDKVALAHAGKKFLETGLRRQA